MNTNAGNHVPVRLEVLLQYMMQREHDEANSARRTSERYKERYQQRLRELGHDPATVSESAGGDDLTGVVIVSIQDDELERLHAEMIEWQKITEYHRGGTRALDTLVNLLDGGKS